MQTTSALYKTLLASPDHKCEWRVVINGVTYGQGSVNSIQFSSMLFSDDTPMIGACVAGELSVEIVDPETIPRMAEVRPSVRLVKDTQSSEWLPMGVYYIDTREKDTEAETLKLHCYDAMLKADQMFLSDEEYGDWPRTMKSVVDEIANRMGVTLDSRTIIKTYDVEYPEGYTMREILGYIAVAHGGCWVMTPAGKLRLVTLAEMPPETNCLIDESGDVITFGGVRILV